MRLIDADAIEYDFNIKSYSENQIIVTSLLADKETIDAMPTIEPERGCDECIFKPFKQFQQKPQWIPCSERLPEIDKEVLVTDGNIYWLCSLFESPDIEDGFYQWEDSYGHWHEVDAWIAWMPLPEPYEKDGDS